MNDEQRKVIEELRDQLLEGLVSSTEASSKVVDVLSTDLKVPELWRKFDEDIRGRTIVLLDDLLIFGT